MATTTYRVPSKREAEFLQANGIDPESVMVHHKSSSSIVLLNLKTNDDITIYPGFLSKRTFHDVWEDSNTPKTE